MRSSLKWDATEGYSPVVMHGLSNYLSLESGCLRVQPKVGGTLLLRLSIGWEPDSIQVPRGKDAKHSEERVKEYLKS